MARWERRPVDRSAVAVLLVEYKDADADQREEQAHHLVQATRLSLARAMVLRKMWEAGLTHDEIGALVGLNPARVGRLIATTRGVDADELT